MNDIDFESTIFFHINIDINMAREGMFTPRAYDHEQKANQMTPAAFGVAV
jgi:hypothetical protein